MRKEYNEEMAKQSKKIVYQREWKLLKLRKRMTISGKPLQQK
jgi:hypothetical protein